MSRSPNESCPPDETLGAFADGILDAASRTAVLEHIEGCRDCMAAVLSANALRAGEAAAVSSPASSRRWWLAVAAAVLVVLVAVPLLHREDPPVARLVAMAPRSARMAEPRLTGGFAWAPYRGSMRANGDATGTEQMKLIGAAADVLERAERDSSADAQRAAAVAMVLIGRAEEAISRLASETKRAPRDAGAWSDLAAAQYAAALAGRTSLYPEALASANRALQLDPQLREAMFNRALILERLGFRDQAREAWTGYLANDSASRWAGEARDHLARLGAKLDKPRFEMDRQQLESAAAAGDESRLRVLAERHAERARAYAEAEYLGRWAEALQKNDIEEAARWLTVSRNIGNALARRSGESLLRDAVQAIDTADAARRLRIAGAHIIYRRGRIAFSRHEPAAGERDLRLAAKLFAAEGSPMSVVARSYAAGARLAQNDVVEAQRELSALLAEIDPARGYLSLGGQVRWELGRCRMFDADWNDAARLFAEAETFFRRGGEIENQARMGGMLADALLAAGRPDEAWKAQIRTFETYDTARRIDLLDIMVGGAATTAMRSGRYETARALVGISESLERGMADDLLLSDTLVRKSLLQLHDDAPAAMRAAQEAASVAMRIPDAALRARHLADADLAMAAALLDSDAARARDLASRALDLYRANGMTTLVAEPCLVRARALLRLGDRAAAERDLDAGIAAVEQHPMSIGGAVIGTGVMDAGNALFEEAIRLDLARGDVAAAFAHAERKRGSAAGAGALDELRERLAGSGTAVLTIVVLPREIVSIIITEREATAARRDASREEVAALAARDDAAAAAGLYELLIRPAAAALVDARALIVVPDPVIEHAPFAAFRDARMSRTLVEWMPVAIAPSAMVLQPQAATARPATIAAVGLPSGRTAGSAALPEAELELADIGGLYRVVRRVEPADVDARAIQDSVAAVDVLHIAGHTEGDADAGGEALPAAGGTAVSWRAIAAMRDLPSVVVLSACNTLRRPSDADRRALSLAGAFIAAGARDVVGTLAPIGDADARALFFAFHEQLARGVAAPAALRHVQLSHRGRPGGAWRRLALLTTTIHRTN